MLVPSLRLYSTTRLDSSFLFLPTAAVPPHSVSCIMSGVTFKVADHLPSVVRTREHSPSTHYLANFEEFRQEKCGTVLQESKWNYGDFYPRENGFVDGIMAAYNQHHNLVIRPDDVWLAIAIQFGLYVNGNAETLRSMFVEHQGKKELVVKDIGTLTTVDYGKLAQKMSEELKKNVKDRSICDWILPNFSTTTDDDTIVGSVALMATMKNYFTYKASLLCGIPQVTLAGSVRDWEAIHNRIDKLENYGTVCSKWARMLKTITAKFLETSKGNIDLKFWSQICHYSSFGSGSAYLSGWVSVFCVFSKEGTWQANNFTLGKRTLEFPVIDTDDVPPGYLTVDLLVDDNGMEHKTLMFCGHMGYGIVDERKGIAPKLSWAIVLKKQSSGESLE